MAEQHEKALVPQIRFTGFTDPWEQRKLGDILQERNIRTSDFEGNPIFSLTIEDGVTPKTDRYERTSLITKTEDLFKIVSPNEFVTNPMNLRFGAFGYNKNSFSVCVSGYYDVFSIDNDKCSGFWSSYFKTPIALKRFDDAATGSLIEKRRVKFSTLCQLVFLMPEEMKEKKQIAAFFDRLDSLITLHQRKYDKLCVLKKSMLDKMFPKGGSLYPEIRFAGFTDPWEQRKLGELFVIGGSGGTPSATNASYYGGDIPFLGISDIKNRDITITAKSITEKGLENSAAWIIPAGSICLAMYASVGKAGINRVSLATSQAFYNMVFEDETLRDFIYTRLEKADTDNEWNPLISTGTQANLNADKVKSFRILLPSSDERRLIAKYFADLDSLITLHQRKLELLRNIKKSMLDKMFV